MLFALFKHSRKMFVKVLLGVVLFHSALGTFWKPKVHNGHICNPDNHKHLVRLHTLHPPCLCTGSILTNRWILSAAHCYKNVIDLSVSIYVKHYHSSACHHIATSHSSLVVAHPSYPCHKGGKDIWNSDVALVKTLGKIKFSLYVQPIRIATIQPNVGTKAVIAGYGESEEGVGLENAPREGEVEFSHCSSKDSKLLCSRCGTYCDDGDSGGAVTCEGKLVGITVAKCLDHGCQENSIYVSVAAHASWINIIINK